jgi:hypothetical protein
MIRRPVTPKPVVISDEPQPKKSIPPLLWQGKVMPAFWTVTGILSLVVNVILIVVLVVLGRLLFDIKALVNDGLIGGLYQNFVLMDKAHIQTTILVEETIRVEDTIPVVFDLPLNTDTTVVLTEDTPIPDTFVHIKTDIISLDAPAVVTLPKGTPLNINLDIVVPVNQTIPVVLNVPVKLKVPVDIPLEATQLHQPFVGLQGVVSPYRTLLNNAPDGWEETPVCGPLTMWLCSWLFDLE